MPHRYALRLLPALALSILLAGCVSTQDRYERALALDAEGRHADAVRYYARVLDREPAYADARARLEAAGALAVARALERAEAAEGVGDYEAAVRALDDLDAVRRTAAGVGVALDAPADLDVYRAGLTDEAYLALVRRGEAEEARGRWREALRAYDRADERYAHAPGARAELDRARVRVYLRWAEDELGDRRYRAAYDRAADALALAGPEAAAHAEALQAEAVAAGTRGVAFLPLGMTEAAGRALPRHVLNDLNTVLTLEHWAAPPLFLTAADPAAVHRAARRHADRSADGVGVVGPGVAAAVGALVDADWAVFGRVVRFEETAVDVRESARPARLRGRAGADTSYVVRAYTRVLTAEVVMAAVDVRTGTVLFETEETVSVRAPFREGLFGDPRELALSDAERRLFDRDAHHEAVRAQEEDLVDDLAARVADRTFDALVRRID